MYVGVEAKTKNNSGCYKGVWERDLVPYYLYIFNFVPCAHVNSKNISLKG